MAKPKSLLSGRLELREWTTCLAECKSSVAVLDSPASFSAPSQAGQGFRVFKTRCRDSLGVDFTWRLSTRLRRSIPPRMLHGRRGALGLAAR